jgi:hypothetical protein
MGIGGHMLGDRKLRWVNRNTGMNFDRAFRYHDQGEGRFRNESGECEHWDINFRTWEVQRCYDGHWASCYGR